MSSRSGRAKGAAAENARQRTAVVMAGGLGSRMRPLTYTIPKPLLPIGERPILEIILSQLKKCGFGKVFITTGYQAELVKSYFGDGSRFGVALEYTNETEMLGTAGALFLLKGKIAQPFLVMNCDILTKLDLGQFFASHLEGGATMTVGATTYDVEVPYGVLEVKGETVRGVVEKPRASHLVAAGVYAMNQDVLELDHEGRMDIPELLKILISAGKKVVVHRIKEPWMDVGKMSDYEKAGKELALWGDV
ncbi:MAG: NTP transferase domain-containing protein [Candidatus Eiseniibacteriota bacterium]|nr:MAG: NTP transferase domain-containing protein [Candidatus Eisenbacteria bacterium]